MKSTFRGLCCAGLLTGFAALAPAASMTMTGMISDSMCGVSHAAMIAGHPKLTEHECTLECAKAGAKYVFVSGDKVYKISNQDLAALSTDAGYPVSLTGDVTGDTIKVSKVTKTNAKPKAKAKPAAK